jgi:hypothetical protein
LRNFGLKVGMAGKVKFEARIKELVENLPDLAVLVEPTVVKLRVPATSCAGGRGASAGECGVVKRPRNRFILTVTAAVVRLGRTG